MHHSRLFLLVFVSTSAVVSNLNAEDKQSDSDAMRNVIAKALPIIEKGAAGSAEQRKCFTCHNQAMPVLALVEAEKRSFKINKENLKRQVDHTVAHLKRGRKNYLEGKGQGGRVVTAGYALWALEAADWESDEMTTAVTGFLLTYQKKTNHWRQPGKRPPSSGSDFTATYVALRALSAFGTEDQRSLIETRSETVGKWLLEQSPRDTEDRVFRLRAFKYVAADEKIVQQATKELIDAQRKDGGWSQKPDMESDAYATATVLVALLRAGKMTPDHEAVRRGVKYLVDTQLEDGSWHVVSRAKPFQTYFETGFPHKKDQFISIAASSWATLALLLTIPESE